MRVKNYKLISFLLVSVFLITVTITVSCKKNPSSDEITYLFKATFTDNWLPQEFGQAIIFISDENGNVLAENTWSGNSSFELYMTDENETIPSSISVTTIHYNTKYDWHYFSTDIGIEPGSDWTWYGNPINSLQEPQSTILDFQNIPDHAGYVVSTKWTSIGSRSGSLNTPYIFDHWEKPTDLYINLNTTNGGKKYISIEDVAENTITTDLTNMNSMNSYGISLNGTANGCSVWLYGYPYPGNRSLGRYEIDYNRSFDPTQTITVSSPPSLFSDYRTSITYRIESYEHEYYQATFGDIPSDFTKTNTEFDILNTSRDYFKITAIGDFHFTASGWTNDEIDASWYIRTNNDKFEYSLPILPNSVVEMFHINRSDFNHWYTDLFYYPDLSSWYEILDIVYKSPDYLSDIINGYRRHTKYSPDGLGKIKTSIVNMKEIRKDPYQ